MASYTEVERKYDVGQHLIGPELHDLPDVASVAQPVTYELDAVYFDTAELDLVRGHVTLRRRVGGDDEGWHLKLPADGDAREEVRRPLSPDPQQDLSVPSELLDRVRHLVLDHPVIPVARIRTERRTSRLMGGSGGVLAEFCDDAVTAERLHPDQESATWREWEFELVDGDAQLLAAADERLLASGAQSAAGPSKLARVLAPAIEKAQSGTGRASSASPDSSTGAALMAYIAAMVERLEQHDPLVRKDAEDAVHQMRVACRRLRSVLATYRPILDRRATDPIRDELQWLGGELSLARDSEVMLARLEDMVRDEPADLVMGPVTARLDRHLRDRHRTGREHAEAALNNDRYFRLLETLRELVAHPPLTEAAQEPAAELLPRLLHRDAKRLRKRVRLVSDARDPESRDHALHEVRKAAKRLRYAADSAVPVLGERAQALSELAEAVQDTLGEHQDTTVSREVLRTLGAQAHEAGENGFAFGRLHAREEARAVELRRDYEDLLTRFPSTKIKAWVQQR
jgi:CHAD domain-containing protein